MWNRKTFGTPIFSEASQNEYVDDFPLRSYRWKDLMRKKPLFIGASQNKYILGIAPGKNS
ncbi:MAG: hypothetical protein F6K23_05815 [Okeania sp. SIO2C9]|uniref:hypothetical protein n=1 Tax=Okeania sp. SIO2C9 TaxID=2607791 RepID=UPI0013BF9B02|nr:hypothetical protein [Okeania sp. SIO2C9]NEQ72626.1 hypothetical protein [Okeania sp. SIO2C9]